jgi:hypothetical protein
MMSKRDNRWNRVVAAIGVILMCFTLMMTYDAGFRAGLQDAEYDPTSLTITTTTIPMNASFYNDTWYGPFGYSDDVRAPTVLHNDSFLITIHIHWGTGYFSSGHNDHVLHANITVEILPFFWSFDNLTIDRIIVLGQNFTDRKEINLYNNDVYKMTSIDYMNIGFFGYGSADTLTSSGICIWTARPMAFTVGPIWTEESG